MPLARILVVEDDASIRRGLVDCLRFKGYEVEEAGDGKAGFEAAASQRHDLILLDVLLPKLDGFGVLREIRRTQPTLPVIMLTAKGEEADKVRALEGGADDYVVKPFGVNELIARVEAVLRRSPQRPVAVALLSVGGRRVDVARREVTLANGSVHAMSDKECQLLQYLAMHRGRAIAREELLQHVWGLDPRGMQTRTVDMAIARLRDLLQDDATDPRVILTVRAKGYMLARDAAEESGQA